MEKVVTCALIQNNEKEVLVGLRAAGIGKNQWALIGGKPNAGEEPIDAIVREVKEEVGLDLIPKFWKKTFDTSSSEENPWRVYLYIGIGKGEIVIDFNEILEVRYIKKSDLNDLDLAFNHRELLLEFFELV